MNPAAAVRKAPGATRELDAETTELSLCNIRKASARQGTHFANFAELIDNARAAGATAIDIAAVRPPESSIFVQAIAVRDDGRGMSLGELNDALLYGRREGYSSRPLYGDNGFHGCGMKLAVGGLCRAVAVFTCTSRMEISVGAFFADRCGLVRRATRRVDPGNPEAAVSEVVALAEGSVLDWMLRGEVARVREAAERGLPAHGTSVVLCFVEPELCLVTRAGLDGTCRRPRDAPPHAPGADLQDLRSYLRAVYWRPGDWREVPDIEIRVDGRALERPSADAVLAARITRKPTSATSRVRFGAPTEAGAAFLRPGTIALVVCGRFVASVPAVEDGEWVEFFARGGCVVYEVSDPRHFPLADTKDCLFENGAHNVRASVKNILRPAERARLYGKSEYVPHLATGLPAPRKRRPDGYDTEDGLAADPEAKELAAELDVSPFYQFRDGGSRLAPFASWTREERDAAVERAGVTRAAIARTQTARRRLCAVHVARRLLQRLGPGERSRRRADDVYWNLSNGSYDAWLPASNPALVALFRDHYWGAGEGWKRPEAAALLDLAVGGILQTLPQPRAHAQEPAAGPGPSKRRRVE